MKNIDGPVSIMCGDSIKRLKEIETESIDLTVTSPPYDNLREYGQVSCWNLSSFVLIAEQLYRITKEGGVVVWIVNDETINGSESGTSFKQALWFKEIGFNIHDTMIWQKVSPFQHSNRYIQSFEYMFILSKGRPKTANLICDRRNLYSGEKIHGTERQRNGKTKALSAVQKSKSIKEYGARLNIWQMSGVRRKNEKTEHPAQFPEQLAIDHIITWSNEGDLVLDCFMGSGTTGVAAIKTGRKFIGIEINDNYYQIARERIETELMQTRLF